MKITTRALKSIVSTLVFAIVFSFGAATYGQKRGQAPQKPLSKAASLVDEANKLADDRKYPEAIEAYKGAIRTDPNYAPGHGGLGDAYFNSGNWEQALAEYKEQVRLAPNDAQGQFDLGYFYNAVGRHGEAFAPLVKATALDPTFAEAFYGIGYAYLRGADFQKSIPFFRSAIRIKPDYGDAYYGLGQAYARLGKADLANEQLRKLTTIDPKLAEKLTKDFPAMLAAADAVEKPARKSAETETQPSARAVATPTVPLIKQASESPIVKVTDPVKAELSTSRESTKGQPVSPQPAQPEPNRQLVQSGSERANNGRRIALVIGNGAYTNAPPLRNPANDARDMAAALKTLGFEVTSNLNVNQRDMKRAIREFGLALKGGGAGLFYYAGHGVQSKGHNYLVPIDADIQSEAEVEDFGVDVNLVLNFMDDAQNGLNIVILDACRNNPFGRSFRSASDGLAQVDAPTGTLIAYATAPGRVASDGSGRNGLYTSELLRQMPVSGLNVTEVFMRVRAEVMKQTVNKQVPWEASSLVGAFYFSRPPAIASKPGPTNSPETESKVDPAAFELSYWESIKNSDDAEEFKSYLEKYPNGHFAVLANNKLRQMNRNRAGTGDVGDVTTASDARKPLSTANPAVDDSGTGDHKAVSVKTFAVRDGFRRTNGVLELSPEGLRFREVGGKNDFAVPCSALLVVTINTSWGSTQFHRLYIKYSFNGVEKEVNLDGKNNKQTRDEILDTCKIQRK